MSSGNRRAMSFSSIEDPLRCIPPSPQIRISYGFCPVILSDDDLWSFLLGGLPEPLNRAVACHLESCPECEAAARRLDDRLTDPLISSLRQALGPDAGQDTP